MSDEVRFAYVLNSDSLNKAMDCLERALEQYQKEMKSDTKAVLDDKLV